ncbi:MAG: site-2 protease family protein [Euryarchaeota archaeon]|jgi:Zn-dependent protease|uniref:site-2 protease family protein n=1 Tax=Methanobacterium sp. MZD130B TaxID=3394378 RepID=UPI0009CE6DEC|nr:site-2 protease family protein [Euryarchaeota archaeon]OPZ88613.1 MAG: Peptidase family M50 [Firmicutes bacterium ADurb.Bin419]HHT19103.1 site-2 protease family protein [Methanobacterium sp.]
MIHFTSNEIRDLIISLLIISGLFAYIFSRGAPDTLSVFISYFPITLVAVGLGFILHELAHKFVAIKYGYPAEYKMWPDKLVFAIIFAVAVGVVFAAPGAVYVYGELSRKENGIVSIAGPITSISLAVIFLLLMQFNVSSQLLLLFFMGFFINSFLAVINLLPVWGLDGKKVLNWNIGIWLVTMGIAFSFTAYAMNSIYQWF